MSNEIAVIEKIEELYPAIAGESEGIREILEDNMEEGFENPFELEFIVVPSGKGKVWERDVDGYTPSKTLNGIIIGKLPNVRAYYENEDMSGVPPTCSSFDGKFGRFTTPDGEVKTIKCSTCPKNQFGSGKDGRGKACSHKAWLFTLLEGEILPSVIVVPWKSRKNYKKYMRNLTSSKARYWTVVTAFGIEKGKTDRGQDYSIITFEKVADIPADKVEAIRAYRDGFSSIIEELKAGTMPMSPAPEEEEHF